MLTRHALTVIAIAALVGSAQAANILFVDNEAPDSSWQTLIESGGHTYTEFMGQGHSFSLNTQAAKDFVNGFDVIVVSGSNPAFNALRAYGAAWNTLPTPMINMGNYLASGQFSSASWNWTTPNTAKANSASGLVDVLVPDDLVFTGVTLTPGTPQTVDMYDGSAGHLNLDNGNDSLLPNITTIAVQSSDADYITIAYAAPDALRAGSQQQYLLAGTTGGNQPPVVFSEAGEQVFLNAIGVLSGELVPEPASVALLGLGGLLIAGRRRR